MRKLDQFGKLIAEDLRDSALNHYLDVESGFLGSVEAKSLNEQLSGFTEEQKKIVRKILTNSIDSGIHDFLFAIEEKNNGIRVTIDGQDISELSDGLQGEIFTEDGWFEKYSQHKQNGI